MRILRLLLAGLVAATGLMLVAPAPAMACSCVGGDAEQFASWSDVVFTGTLVARTPPPEGAVMSSTDPATHLFDVDEVFQGDVGSEAEVLSAVSGASCGLEGMAEGTRYVVFAGYHDVMGEPTEMLWANLCGGTAPASHRFVEQVSQVTGPGRAPVGAGGAVADVAAGPAGTTTLVDDPDEGPPAWLIGGGIALFLVAGVAIVGLALRRRGPSGD